VAESRKFGRWFRAYDECVDDPKIQTLGDGLGFFWFNCLCLASKGRGILPPARDIAWKLRKTEAKVTAMIGQLMDAGLLEAKGGGFSPHNWDERQFSSDISTERVNRFRQRQKQPETVSRTLHETMSSVSVFDSVNKQEKPIERKREALNAGVIEDWIESVIVRHPNKRDLGIARTYLCECSGIEGAAWRAEFDRVHKLWCRTSAWVEKQGAYAPKLAAWVLDQGWKYPPPETKSELQRLMEGI
jgi:hypothetical protein